MELSLARGIALSATSAQTQRGADRSLAGIEAVLDLRTFSGPSGFGGVLRAGGVFGSGAVGLLEGGVTGRVELLRRGLFGIDLGAALGPSLAYGELVSPTLLVFGDSVEAFGYGGFLQAELTFLVSHFFVSVSATTRIMGFVATHDDDVLEGVTTTITPGARVGFDWTL